MKFSGLLFMALIFLVIPYLLLELAVMPMLDELKTTYQNVDTISQRAVQE